MHINFSKADLCHTQTFVSWSYVGILTYGQYPNITPDQFADIQQLALSLLQTQPVTVCRVMSFLGKANFCAYGHSQLWRLCHVIQSDMLMVYHYLTHLFSPVYFSFSTLHQLEWLSHLQQSPALLQFLLPYVVIATDAMPSNWAFIFRDLVCHYQ